MDSIGMIGVFVSLIYMAWQIRQQAEETRLARSQALITVMADADILLANDPTLAEIIRRGGFDFAALDTTERVRFSSFYFAILTHCDFAYCLYSSGKIEKAIWEQTERDVETFLGLPGGRTWWAQDKSRFSAGFQDYMDQRLREVELPDFVPVVGMRPPS